MVSVSGVEKMVRKRSMNGMAWGSIPRSKFIQA